MEASTRDHLEDQIKFYTSLADSISKELKIYSQAAELASHQLLQLVQDGDEEQAECMATQIGYYTDLYKQAETQYFEACAEVWVAQADLKSVGGNSLE